MSLAERLTSKCQNSPISFASLPNIQFSDNNSAANIINRHTSHLKGVYLLNQNKKNSTNSDTTKKRLKCIQKKERFIWPTDWRCIEVYAINLGLPWWLCFISGVVLPGRWWHHARGAGSWCQIQYGCSLFGFSNRLKYEIKNTHIVLGAINPLDCWSLVCPFLNDHVWHVVEIERLLATK